MEASPVCRICLSTEASQDISDLKSQQSGKTCSEIVLFCLNIQVENDSNISTKLCLKCFRKITSFYNFKLLALKNDAYLKSLESRFHIKSEAFLDEDLKTEEHSSYDSDGNEWSLGAKIKQEPITYENQPDDCPSDDELLSEIKKIKYEFIPEANEIKENEKVDLTTKKRKTDKKIILKPQDCQECGKRVKNLKEHMLRHVRHRDPSSRLPCPLCDKTFSSYDSRSKHKRKTHLSQTMPCPICHKVVKNLKSHTRHLHNSSKLRYECVHCEKRFISSSQLNMHASIHTKDRPHTCDECNKTFRLLGQMTSHKHDEAVISFRSAPPTTLSWSSSVHPVSLYRRMASRIVVRGYPSIRSIRPWLYPASDSATALAAPAESNGILLSKKREVHGKKTRMCQFCSKSFSREHHLERHLLIHTKERPYKCKQCDKAFNTTTTLKNHMYVHTKKQPFVCKICDMRFTSPRYLANHMLTHTREKRYPCSYCDMKFHRSDHVRQHEAAVHKIKKRSLINSGEI